MQTTQPTIRNIGDIAQLAGVAKSTVSRALSDSPLISQQTKNRILAIAEANHFAVHQGARNLSLQRSQTIAVIIPINPKIDRLITDPFNIELLGAVANALTEYDYDLLVAQIQDNDRRAFDRYLSSKRADGLILFACDTQSEEVARLIQHQAPFIMWGPPAPNESYCSVGSDDVMGGYLATKHLLELGRQRIAFVGGAMGKPEAIDRYQGYEQALYEAGRAVDPQLVRYGEYTSRLGYEITRQFLTQCPDLDGIFANSDLIAIGAMEAVREQQRQVPQDIAVVGYDGIALAAHCSPPLTTIRQDLAQAGRLLVDNLLSFIEHGRVTSHVLPVELIVRQSTVS